MLLYDTLVAPNPTVVRIFILERGGLKLKVQAIDIMNLENRRLAYRTEVNKRGELPALRLDDGSVLTEITAICGYLDEVAEDGHSLFGSTPSERAVTNMWLRRMDLEIAQPLIAWYRNGAETIDFYRGHRTPIPEARVVQKVQINQALNMLDDDLDGKQYLCGTRFSAADIHLYGIVKPMLALAPWVNAPSRLNVMAWFDRMDNREACQRAIQGFGADVSV
ncbi:glutathione S-transferase [Thelonectria olida]|uniref:Glutathione S-transferase n=1 Tax=Thelonectria olida TaxID=1576542 RepID=A0A9P8W4Z5_9HYPO|nr:glutathione S-transferase [Thelonectria olida]